MSTVKKAVKAVTPVKGIPPKGVPAKGKVAIVILTGKSIADKGLGKLPKKKTGK